ncbi:MAG: PEP-CTERM sorting domain-containing protein [Heteroscytonema crispum UTEX LB 1556]
MTTAASVWLSPSARAATFDFDQLKNISSRPIDSDNRLQLFGNPADKQGYTAFFNLDPSALDSGHGDISLNASGNGAPYYVTGRQGSPEVPASGATRTSTVADIVGFPTLSSYLTNNSIPLSSIGFSFSQKSDRDFTKTWNLGNDRLGEDWFASPDSPIEERIYKANPDDVETFLSFGTTKILNFGYSNIYSVLNYGSTTALADDIDSAFTDPVSATKVAGLDPLTEGLANALLQDVNAAGGKVQLVIEDNDVQVPTFTTGNGFGVLNFRLVGSLRAVRPATVPEPNSVSGLLLFGSLGGVFSLKKRQLKMRQD